MADKLDWLEDHLLLLKHRIIADLIANENYKVPFELRKLASDLPVVEDYIKKLSVDKKFKEANEALAYDIHPRALAWWGYNCVLSLNEELKVVPAEDLEISKIGEPKEFDIPDFAKEPELSDEQKALLQADKDKAIKELEDQVDADKKALDLIMGSLTPDDRETVDEVKNLIFESFKDEVGKDPFELIDGLLDDMKDLKQQDIPLVDEENSPIFKAERELKEKIEKIRKETIDTIESALPKKSKEELLEVKTNLLNATYSYIQAPNDLNAKNCLDLGNVSPDTPEGLLALVCFWTYGNLMPGTNQLAKTPDGLAANGFMSLLNLCSLHKGGTKKPKERIECYFEIGRDIALGKNTWADEISKNETPHERIDFNEVRSAFKQRLHNDQASSEEPRKTVERFNRFKPE